MTVATGALAKAMRKAMALFAETELFHRFRINAMSADFSWNRTAAEYIKVYERAVKGGKAPKANIQHAETLK